MNQMIIITTSFSSNIPLFKVVHIKLSVLELILNSYLTSQSVINIIICQNVILVSDMLRWRYEIQPGAIFNTIFEVSVNKSRGTYIGHQHHYTPECDIGDWLLMLVTWFVGGIRFQNYKIEPKKKNPLLM